MLKIITLLFTCLILASCLEKKVRDLESPCVANEYGANDLDPCVRRPVNIWIGKI